MNIESLCEYVYEDLNGLVTSVTLGEELLIRFECDSAENPKARRVFELTCQNMVESTARPSPSSCIELLSDHPLLWNSSGQRGYLYYSSAPSNRYELFARIWEVHEKVFSGFRPVTDYVNGFFSHGSLTFCPDSNGLLADGPKQILDIYEAVARDYLQLKFVPSVSLGGEFKALIFDECFVICGSVSVAEIFS